MSGHGHVYPNPDGSKARCGGPGLCMECSLEADQKKLEDLDAVPAPTPERPTTEEGEELPALEVWQDDHGRLSVEMKSPCFRDFGPGRHEYVPAAQLASAQEVITRFEENFAKQTEALARSNRERDAAVTRMHDQDTWAAVCMEERDAAQEEVRKLKEAAEILFNFEKQNLQIQQELASLREENERLKKREVFLDSAESDAIAESARLRELLQVAEGALDYVERRTNPEQKNPTEHHFIRSTRLRGVAVAALARLRSGKDGGKKDG